MGPAFICNRPPLLVCRDVGAKADCKTGPQRGGQAPAAIGIAGINDDPRAAGLSANRAYRYLNRSILCNRIDHRILKSKGTGLVHAPDLHLYILQGHHARWHDDLCPEHHKALYLPPETPNDEIPHA